MGLVHHQHYHIKQGFEFIGSQLRFLVHAGPRHVVDDARCVDSIVELSNIPQEFLNGLRHVPNVYCLMQFSVYIDVLYS